MSNLKSQSIVFDLRVLRFLTQEKRILDSVLKKESRGTKDPLASTESSNNVKLTSGEWKALRCSKAARRC